MAASAAAALAADMTALDVRTQPALAGELKKQQKHVILLWLAGGASQLETWDPKPGAATGGPFRSIPTSIPGLEISELMPKMAQRMKHTCVIRSLNTKNGDHGAGDRAERGRHHRGEFRRGQIAGGGECGEGRVNPHPPEGEKETERGGETCHALDHDTCVEDHGVLRSVRPQFARCVS
jgi:hypothetical protein